MPRIEMGPLRPIGALDTRLAGPSDSPGGNPQRVRQNPSVRIASDVLDPGPPPVDAERVAEIRRAIETGTYPVIPTRVADAIIAARHLLRSTT